MKTIGYEKDYYGKDNFSVRNQKMSSQESSPPPKMKNEFSSGSHEDLYRKAKSTISAGTYLDFIIIKENLALQRAQDIFPRTNESTNPVFTNLKCFKVLL